MALTVLSAGLPVPHPVVAGARPAAPQAVIRVPVDYATIQAAIDAAREGDEIRVQGGESHDLVYPERLTITRGITLSGGWNSDFSETRLTNPTVLNAEGQGRAISIALAVSTTVVTIYHLQITGGDATGLGGWQADAPPSAFPAEMDNPGRPVSGTLDAGDGALELAPSPAQAQAVQARQARLDGLLERHPRPAPAPSAWAPYGEAVDCGGGVYSANASLHLIENAVFDNQASRTRSGYGGGVCIVQAPDGGVVVDRNFITGNHGADQGGGNGGGLYINAAPGAAVTDNDVYANVGSTSGPGAGGGIYLASERALLAGNVCHSNTASVAGEGFGGGVAIVVPGVSADRNAVNDNIASAGDMGLGGGLAIARVEGVSLTANRVVGNLAGATARGVGGGLFLSEVGAARVENNTFADNTATSAPGVRGTGGGAYARASNGVAFIGNEFSRNLGGLNAGGLGGGLYLFRLSGAVAQNNRFTGNWGMIHGLDGGGGAIGLGNVHHSAITSNTLDSNVAALYPRGGLDKASHGGGLYAVVVADSRIAGNTFSGNVATWNGVGRGGGLSTSPDAVSDTERLVIADNIWQDNVATLGQSTGDGGAVHLRILGAWIERNRFVGNRGSADGGQGKGGAVYVEGNLVSRDVTIDSNVFLGNRVAGEAGDFGDGGAINVFGADRFTITNNLLVSNTARGAGGMALNVRLRSGESATRAWVANNTIVGARSSAGIHVLGGTPADGIRIVNNILVSHTTAITVDAANEAQTWLSYNLFQGNDQPVGGAGAYTHTDPVAGPAAFVNPLAGDYHLLKSSAARDAGDPAGVPPAPGYDADGIPRPFGPRVDIGAYEWYTTTVRVPGDYATIQAAIDAALPGSTILVRAGGYDERLRIGKAITLSGGWNADFTGRTLGASMVDGAGQGRVVSITTPPGTMVVIDGFTLANGDATGQGGLDSAATAGGPLYSIGITFPMGTAARPPADVPARLAELAARGVFPGGAPAAAGWRAEIDRLAERARPAAAPAAPHDALDCGGGIYSLGASLRVQHTDVVANVASRTGYGYGGGICAIDGNGVVIEYSTIHGNTASQSGTGMGGGVYLGAAPQARVQMNTLEDNLATQSGVEGFGGGLAAYNAAGLELLNNAAAHNAASTTSDGRAGVGGGAYLMHVDGARVEHNTFLSNTAAISVLMARAGGLGVYDGQGVVVQDNQFVDNLAAYQFLYRVNGGGLSLDGLAQATVVSNTLAGNIAVFMAPDMASPAAGGLYGLRLSDSWIGGNIITGNVGSVAGSAIGGGAYLEPSAGAPTQRVTLAGNTFWGNVATLSDAGGYGGGLALFDPDRYVIQHNLFQANRAGTDGDGLGGGARLLGNYLAGTSADGVVLDGNWFIGNAASLPRGGDADRGGGGLIVQAIHSYSLVNNILAGNSGDAAGGAYLSGGVDDPTATGELVNNTFVANTPSALELYGWFSQPITLVNNIVVSHALGISVTAGSTALASYTLWDGNGAAIGGPGVVTETHPVTGPVAFVAPAAGNYRLQMASAARDAGDPAGVPPAPDHDAAGVPRPQGLRVDIGAYEFLLKMAYLPLVGACRPIIGWAVGDVSPAGGQPFGTILHTTDGGCTWARQGTEAEIPEIPLKEVSAVDAQNAWVVGQHAILRTRDGGQTWQQASLPPDLPASYELQGIKALGADVVYVVGVPSVLLQTTNGITWTHMPRGAGFPDNVAFQVVDAVDASHVWAVGSTIVGMERRQPIIAFYDGVEWRLQSTAALTAPTTAVIGVSAIDAQHAWAVGGFGMPLATTADGGATWQVSPYLLSAGDMNRVVAVSPTTGWAVGDYGSVMYTTDGGGNWTEVKVPGAFLFGVTALDSQTAWVVGPGVHGTAPGIIARTVDAVHWEVQSDPSWPNMDGISFVGGRR